MLSNGAKGATKMKSSRVELPAHDALVVTKTSEYATVGEVISKYHALYGEIFWDHASEEQVEEYRAQEAYFKEHGKYPL